MKKVRDEQQVIVQTLGKVYYHLTIPDKSAPVLCLLTCIPFDSVSFDLSETIWYILSS